MRMAADADIGFLYAASLTCVLILGAVILFCLLPRRHWAWLAAQVTGLGVFTVMMPVAAWHARKRRKAAHGPTLASPPPPKRKIHPGLPVDGRPLDEYEQQALQRVADPFHPPPREVGR